MTSYRQHLGASRWVWLPLSLMWLWSQSLATAAAVQSRADLKAVLNDPVRGWSNSTTLSFPETPSFMTATERWTVYNPPTYRAAVSPGTEEDVMKTVKLAASLKIPFLATGGRHSYSTSLGDCRDGLAIDLSQLKHIEVNKSAETVTVGPGAIMDDILNPLYEAGLMLQTGTAWCPSVIGVTLGGGVGRFQGMYGLVIDALESVRIVTAEGNVVEASPHQNQDLFWGIRGAGANFGIITSATYKVHRLRNQGNIFTVDFTFPTAELSSQFFKAASDMGRDLPDEMAGNAFISFNSKTNQTQTVSNWMYYGTEEAGRRAMKPLYDIAARGGQHEDYYVGWNKLMNTTSGGMVSAICRPGHTWDIYSLNIRRFDPRAYDRAFAKLTELYTKFPGARGSSVQFDFYPGRAMRSTPSDATAWPWRDALGFLNAGMTWTEGDAAAKAAAQALGREVRRDVAATAGYPGISVFINYARGDEKLEQIFSREKLPRLARLKKQWDPNQLFSFNMGLPTRYP